MAVAEGLGHCRGGVDEGRAQTLVRRGSTRVLSRQCPREHLHSAISWRSSARYAGYCLRQFAGPGATPATESAVAWTSRA
eukprot:1101692-Pyramimonas_sp.AAC.1